MKIKILIFPLAVVIFLAIFIGYIQPEYAKMRENTKQLKEKEAVLQKAVERGSNISSLVSNLDSNSDKEKIVLNYFPYTDKQEEVVNGAYYLAVSSSVYLVNLDFKPVENQAVAVQTGGEGAGLTEEQLAQMKKEAAKKTNTVMNIVGTYENIRNFVSQLYKLERSSDILSVNIFKNESTSETADKKQSDPNSLNAKLAVNFNYLPQQSVSKDQDLPIFSQSAFDYASVEKIQQLIVKKIPPIEIGASGRTNPFAP